MVPTAVIRQRNSTRWQWVSIIIHLNTPEEPHFESIVSSDMVTWHSLYKRYAFSYSKFRKPLSINDIATSREALFGFMDRTATGFEGTGIISRSYEKNPWMHLLVNIVPNRVLLAISFKSLSQVCLKDFQWPIHYEDYSSLWFTAACFENSLGWVMDCTC